MASSKSLPTLFLLAVLTCCAISQAFRSAAPASGIDFYQFWAVGRAVARHESSDIYSTEGRARLGSEFLAEAMQGSSSVQRAVAEHRRVFDTTSTPFLYAVFGSLSTSDYEANLRWYRIGLLGCFVLGTVGISTLLGHSTTNTLLSLSLLSLWFEPLASDLRVGNVGCIQLAGIAIYALLRLKLAWRYKDLLAGIWMGILLAFKPNLVFVAVLLLLGSLQARRWHALLKEAAAMAIGAVAAIAVSALALGSVMVWFDWVEAVRGVPDASIAVDMGNLAPSVLFREQFGTYTGVVLVLAAAGAVALGLYTRRQATRVPGATTTSSETYRVIWLLALGSLGPVLVPRLAWLHYFVLTLPALLLVLLHLPKQLTLGRAAWRQYLSIGAWLGLALNPFAMLGQSFTMRAFGTVTVLATYALLCSLCSAPSELQT